MVQIKICGLTNRDDVLAALEYGADYLGFVLYPDSPRAVSSHLLAEILDSVPDARERAVGVFVNETPDMVAGIMSQCGLHIAQLHGDENPEDFSNAEFIYWRALRLDGNNCVPCPTDWSLAQRYVIDVAVPGMYGGTGVTADWTEAAVMASRYPIMLAGGLTPDNVHDAVLRVKPIGVDVASGVESVPGKKDHGKVKSFIDQVRNTD